MFEFRAAYMLPHSGSYLAVASYDTTCNRAGVLCIMLGPRGTGSAEVWSRSHAHSQEWPLPAPAQTRCCNNNEARMATQPLATRLGHPNWPHTHTHTRTHMHTHGTHT